MGDDVVSDRDALGESIPTSFALFFTFRHIYGNVVSLLLMSKQRAKQRRDK